MATVATCLVTRGCAALWKTDAPRYRSMVEFFTLQREIEHEHRNGGSVVTEATGPTGADETAIAG
jgi:hypothetical protein